MTDEPYTMFVPTQDAVDGFLENYGRTGFDFEYYSDGRPGCTRQAVTGENQELDGTSLGGLFVHPRDEGLVPPGPLFLTHPSIYARTHGQACTVGPT